MENRRPNANVDERREMGEMKGAIARKGQNEEIWIESLRAYRVEVEGACYLEILFLFRTSLT